MPTNHAPTQDQVQEVTEAFKVSVEIAVKQLQKKGLTRSEILHIMTVWGGAALRDMLFEAGK